MQNKNIQPVLGSILQKLAPKIGAKIVIEPTWGIVGQITFKSGSKSYFRYNTLDINTLGASEIATDKDYANFFMKKMNYPTIPNSKTFYSHKWAEAIGAKNRKIDDAYMYANKIGLPVIVKPNNGSQGSGVSKVHNKKEFYSAMKDIFTNSRVALVESVVTGHDYRIVVLDKEIISAYERIPLSVTGDGKSSIEKLLKLKQKEFVKIGRDTQINFEDIRIKNKLKNQKLNLNSVLDKDQKVFLLDNANLSTGGESVDVTKTMHRDFKKIAVKLTADMGLSLCGVDLMIKESIEKPISKENNFYVIEINAAPGLDHYITTGMAQQKIVEDLYMKVLRGIEKN